jgi:uncharacterized protein YjbI with pentapeptide repeats
MNIQDFGKIYTYLWNAKLRIEETGKQRIVIKDADFHLKFKHVSWGYFDFVDCDFESNYDITLDWLTNCTFTDCRFHGNFGWGQVEDVRFRHCKIIGKSGETHFGSDWKTKNLVFEDCEFSNSNDDPNYLCSAGSAGEVMFIGCKGKNFAFKGSRKLTLRQCITQAMSFDTASPAKFVGEMEQMPYSDFLIEDCDLRGGAYMSNAQLNSFVFRRNRMKEFALGGADIKGNALIEDIKEGFLHAAAGYQGKLVIRNCNFPGTEERKYSLEVSACIPTHTLIENVTCGCKPVDIVRRNKPRTKWADPPQSKLIVVKNCKIPHLQANWVQTEHLKIENCEFDSLHIEDGRIGKLEIIGCTLSRLNVSRTQVKEQNVGIYEGSKYSGHITTTDGSNIKLVPRD